MKSSRKSVLNPQNLLCSSMCHIRRRQSLAHGGGMHPHGLLVGMVAHKWVCPQWSWRRIDGLQWGAAGRAERCQNGWTLLAKGATAQRAQLLATGCWGFSHQLGMNLGRFCKSFESATCTCGGGRYRGFSCIVILVGSSGGCSRSTSIGVVTVAREPLAELLSSRCGTSSGKTTGRPEEI